jgi:hypothetical protein
MTKTLSVQYHGNPLGGNLHAGEFKHEGRLYCAAHVPTRYGHKWQLEVKTVPLSVDGGWVDVPAKFNLRAGQLEVCW